MIARRDFVRGALAVGVGCATRSVAQPPAVATSPFLGGPSIFPAVDAHIHLFDPTREGGVPWPEPGDAIYRPSLPSRYEETTRACGVIGAVVVEASPLASDNDWVLKQIADHPIMLGMIGDLVPGEPNFKRELERLHRSALFLGIRYGNLWGRNLALDKDKPGFLDGLRYLAGTGLVFESANPNAELIAALLSLANRIPDLTIVIDHLPHAEQPAEASMRKAYLSDLRQLSQHPRVFVKLSEVLPFTECNGQEPCDRLTAKLDALWELFGPDRVIFGSDWPNSEHFASYSDTIAVVRNYVHAKGSEAMHKFFYRNSKRAYRWKARRPDQIK